MNWEGVFFPLEVLWFICTIAITYICNIDFSVVVFIVIAWFLLANVTKTMMIYILWFLCTIFNIRYRFSMILHWNTMNKMIRSIYIIVEITQRYWQTTSIWKLFYVFVAVKNKQLLRMSNSLLQHHLSISYIYTMCSVYISPLSYKLPFSCWKKMET